MSTTRLPRPAFVAASCLAALASLSVPHPGQALPPAGAKVALLVGITEYDHSHLRPLEYTENDVTELADVLRRSGGYTRVVLLTHAEGARDKRLLPTRANIDRELKALLAKRTRLDTVLVAFSGHGRQLRVKDGAGRPKDESFFCPLDAAPNDPQTLVSLARVYDDLDESGAGTKLLLVDACRDDPADKGAKGIDGPIQAGAPAGTAALYSCKPGQRSFEHKKWRHGAFFFTVLEGLRPGSDGRLPADKDGDGTVDFFELTRYVLAHVPDRVAEVLPEAKQEPNAVLNLSGPAPLVRLVPPAEELLARAVAMKLRLVRAGHFLMGSPPDDRDASPNERPQHKVTLTRPFFMGTHEVTVEQFRTFVQSTGYQTDAEKRGGDPTWKAPGWKQADNEPVVCVSWNDAQAFCAWLARVEEREFRLPTEAEWEYACRAGGTSRFFGGDKGSRHTYAHVPGGPKKDVFPHTAPVGTYKENAFGLFDLHGNAWEWCQDGPREYAGRDETDPVGPRSGKGVLRGGSWENFDPKVCRSAYRLKLERDSSNHASGFRVIAPAEPPIP
jgi:formylglycine-generating enzyme required for sulfatase activity